MSDMVAFVLLALTQLDMIKLLFSVVCQITDFKHADGHGLQKNFVEEFLVKQGRLLQKAIKEARELYTCDVLQPVNFMRKRM